MSDFRGPRAYRPTVRAGGDACPYAVGHWAFLHRHRFRLEHDPRMAPAVRGLDRLSDLDELLEQGRLQERPGGDGPP
ncbi:hypothetical protein ACIRPU_18975 [Streptomyces sp. NPDC102259]|uniref:hypothetical protein n=1 Tax=Streptomyces sp. NPDC102259 TaxID=3366148 RepID=UPI0037F67B72